MLQNNPIGIFDSGIGGLTVAHAIRQIMPNESIVYFGDTAHLPYGDKSAESIIYYSKGITDFLLRHNCKIIVIACNTASAHAYEYVKKHLTPAMQPPHRKGEIIEVIDVINPVVKYVAEHFSGKKIGIIGTKGTIQSKVYENKLKLLNPDVESVSIATGLLASMIEEGFINNAVSKAIIKEYLSSPVFENIDAIILGCTHYPLIKNEIENYFEHKIEVIDSAGLVAQYLKKRIHELKLDSWIENPKEEFYVSDFTPYFEKVANAFFQQKIHLQLAPIWQ